MPEVDRLFTVSPDLVNAVAHCTDSDRLFLIHEACQFALEHANVDESEVWSLFKDLMDRAQTPPEIKAQVYKLRDRFDDEYFERQDETPDKPDAYMPMFYKARAISSVIQACQPNPTKAAMESIYEAVMSTSEPDLLAAKLLQILKGAQAIDEELYSQQELLARYQEIFDRHYQSRVRAWDFDRDTVLDKSAYERVLANVIEIEVDAVSGAKIYRARSPYEAAIFLLGLQCDEGFWRGEPGICKAGQTFITQTSKMVFRTQTADLLPFKPFETHLKRVNRQMFERELTAFAFLMKAISERHVAFSLQAHLWQTVAFNQGIPTQLLDWTSDAYIAILRASSSKPTGAEASVYFTRFEELSEVLLPSPIAKSAFRQRLFFTAMAEEDNDRIFKSASRVSFPVSEFKGPRSFQVNSLPDEQHAALSVVADYARMIAADPQLNFDELNSDISMQRTEAINALNVRLSPLIEKLSEQYNFSRNWWEATVQNWLLEIDNYLHELTGFTNSEGQLFLSEPSLLKLTDRNRDALSLYLGYIMPRSGPAFDSRKPLLAKVAQKMRIDEEQNKPLRMFVKPPKQAFYTAARLSETLSIEQPELKDDSVSKSEKLVASGEDSRVLCSK